jgi:RNA polymerase sigma-70 factor (ECF subfamily)
MHDDDADAWARVLSGDSGALSGLFDRHERRLFHHAARLLTSREDAMDSVMIAFFELWRRRGSVRLVDGSPLPWLLNTVANTARNLERASRRYRNALSALPNEHRHVHLVAGDETGVMEALRKMSHRDQSIIVLTVLEGYSERDAAEALGIPVGTVKSRLSRAKARLRNEMEGAELT